MQPTEESARASKDKREVLFKPGAGKWLTDKINRALGRPKTYGCLSVFSFRTGIPHSTLRQWIMAPVIPRQLFDFMNLWLEIPEEEIQAGGVAFTESFRARIAGRLSVNLFLPKKCLPFSEKVLKMAMSLERKRYYLAYRDSASYCGYWYVPTERAVQREKVERLLRAHKTQKAIAA